MWLTNAAKNIMLLLLILLFLAGWGFWIVFTARIQQPLNCEKRWIAVGGGVYRALTEDEYQAYCHAN